MIGRPTLTPFAFAIVAAILAVPAFAGSTIQTIDPLAELSADGRHIHVTGPIACIGGEVLQLRP